MEPNELLSTVPTSTGAVVRAVRAAGLGASVPTCPGWDLRDLVRHLGNVHRWATRLVAAGGVERLPMEDVAPGDDAELVPWLEAGARRLVDELSTRGPDAPAWNFSGGLATAGFWFRRMAHESAVHAWDAAAAAGQDAPIQPELASDGIDELLTVMLPRRHPEGLAGTLHVHCTDVDGEWLVDLASLSTRREHAKGDAALRGPAADLLLRLTERGTGGEVLGDTSVLDAFVRAFSY